MASPDARVTCVLGMHRSGTSLVAHMLSALGVFLGPPSRLTPADVDNPDGYWEHWGFTNLNEEILRRLGGRWDDLPSFDAGWESRAALADLYTEAAALIGSDFGGAGDWGWKDPRTSVLLPFWQRVVPGLRYVLVLRNPVDVVRSLMRRDRCCAARGFGLWLAYVAHSLIHVQGRPHLIMWFEDVVADVAGESERLARFVGRSLSAAEAAGLQDVMSPRLVHHQSGPAHVIADPDVPSPVKALYLALRLHRDAPDRAGDVMGTFAADALAAFTRAESMRASIDEAHLGPAERERTLSTLKAELAGARAEVAQLRRQVAEQRRVAAARARRSSATFDGGVGAILLTGRPKVEGSLDLPAADTVSSRTLNVAGWAHSREAAIVQVEVNLDDRVLGHASYGWHRGDVMETRVDVPHTACGFQGRFDLKPGSGVVGPRMLRVTITDAAGNTLTCERRVTIQDAGGAGGA